MSYIGSLRRITAWARITGSTPGQTIVAWAVALAAIAAMWTLVTAWYALVLGLYGPLLFSYRLSRRSERKQVHLHEQQLAALRAIARRGD